MLRISTRPPNQLAGGCSIVSFDASPAPLAQAQLRTRAACIDIAPTSRAARDFSLRARLACLARIACRNRRGRNSIVQGSIVPAERRWQYGGRVHPRGSVHAAGQQPRF
jgi:hypothetical protein